MAQGSKVNCRAAIATLHEELSGRAVEAAQQAAVTAHLESCPRCRQEAQQLRRAVSLLHQTPAPEPPDSLAGAIRREVAREAARQAVPSRARRHIPAWASAAAVTLLLAAVLVPAWRSYSNAPGAGREADLTRAPLGSRLPDAPGLPGPYGASPSLTPIADQPRASAGPSSLTPRLPVPPQPATAVAEVSAPSGTSSRTPRRIRVVRTPPPSAPATASRTSTGSTVGTNPSTAPSLRLAAATTSHEGEYGPATVPSRMMPPPAPVRVARMPAPGALSAGRPRVTVAVASPTVVGPGGRSAAVTPEAPPSGASFASSPEADTRGGHAERGVAGDSLAHHLVGGVLANAVISNYLEGSPSGAGFVPISAGGGR
jgi:anti-sigma factor RsiW